MGQHSFERMYYFCLCFVCLFVFCDLPPIDSFPLLQATDDYILQMAKLFKKLVDPGLIVYLEFSNEVWNSQFQVFCGFFFSSANFAVGIFVNSILFTVFLYLYIFIDEYCRSPKIHT